MEDKIFETLLKESLKEDAQNRKSVDFEDRMILKIKKRERRKSIFSMVLILSTVVFGLMMGLGFLLIFFPDFTNQLRIFLPATLLSIAAIVIIQILDQKLIKSTLWKNQSSTLVN